MDLDVQKLYQKVHNLSKKAELLGSIDQLLSWDRETHQPISANDIRSQQIEELTTRIHKERTSPGFAKALSSLIDLETAAILHTSLKPSQVAALKLWRKNYLKAKKLPASFVAKFANAVSNATNVWSIAKQQNDFAKFAPFLQQIVDLSKKKTDILGYSDHPYDALIDDYEPGTTTAMLIPLFADLKSDLKSLLQGLSTKAMDVTPFPKGNFPISLQKDFSYELLDAMGFPKGSFSLDEAEHPFCCGIHPTDIRMTTKIYPSDIISNIFSVLHEGGHGLYHMNLPEKEFGSPICESASHGMDESQSRFWETIIGRSLPFWKYFLPKLKTVFPEQLSSLTLPDFYKMINQVQPTLIRIHSDEVTYSLHIIVRFEIEKGLIEGSIKVKDLPEIWKVKMKEYVGIVPPTDTEGCLQDIHWSAGLLGYFPTYTLGNLYAAQIFGAFEKKFPNWEDLVAKGDLLFIKDFLHKNIHQYGREFAPSELIVKITGQPLQATPYVSYLRKKFSQIYQ